MRGTDLSRATGGPICPNFPVTSKPGQGLAPGCSPHQLLSASSRRPAGPALVPRPRRSPPSRTQWGRPKHREQARHTPGGARPVPCSQFPLRLCWPSRRALLSLQNPICPSHSPRVGVEETQPLPPAGWGDAGETGSLRRRKGASSAPGTVAETGSAAASGLAAPETVPCQPLCPQGVTPSGPTSSRVADSVVGGPQLDCPAGPIPSSELLGHLGRG